MTIVLLVVVLALLGQDQAALAMLLALPAALAVRALPGIGRLDLALCAVLLVAQAGSAAGLTTSTAWWDELAHALTAGLLAAAILRAAPHRSAATAIAVVAVAAVLWEVLEVVCDLALGTDFSAGGGDIVGDLVADLLGAGMGARLGSRAAASLEAT